MYIEKKICEVDGKLTIYLGNLRRLRKRLDILQQVQDAPRVYGQLVTEVVRRKQFSARFLNVRYMGWGCCIVMFCFYTLQVLIAGSINIAVGSFCNFADYHSLTFCFSRCNYTFTHFFKTRPHCTEKNFNNFIILILPRVLVVSGRAAWRRTRVASIQRR